MFKWIHRFGSAPYVYRLAGAWRPWLGAATLACLAVGLYLGLVVAPPDYEQGESYRIIYVHVPAAWMSLFVYTTMAVSSAVFLIWRLKIADAVAEASAPIGAAFTAIALATGSLWGKPMWGTWWVWDARLTSELLLLFLYLGYMALRGALDNPAGAARAAAILAVVGVVNIPIIKFSVDWWNTLHQPASIMRIDGPTMDPSMLWPLLIMAIAFQLMYFHNLAVRLRAAILRREGRARWVRELAEAGAGGGSGSSGGARAAASGTADPALPVGGRA